MAKVHFSKRRPGRRRPNPRPIFLIAFLVAMIVAPFVAPLIILAFPTVAEGTGTFWHATDAHALSIYREGGYRWSDCTVGTDRNSTTACQGFGTPYRDTPFAASRAAGDFMVGSGGDFVVYTGDSAPHTDVLPGLNYDAMDRVPGLLCGGGAVPLLGTSGNHDSAIVDQEGNLVLHENNVHLERGLGACYNFTASQRATMHTGGYWYGPHPTLPGATVFAYNTLLEERYDVLDSKHQARIQRGDLLRVVQRANATGTTVWLLSHKYPGASEDSSGWTDFINGVLESPSVTVYLAGHSHRDEIVNLGSRPVPVPGSIYPEPRSTLRQYFYRSDFIVGWKQWEMDLSTGTFSLRYDTRTFGMDNATASGLVAWCDRLDGDPDLMRSWRAATGGYGCSA